MRREAERLAANGVRELVLTGIHLSSYGRDFKNKEEREDFGDGAANLLELLTLLDSVEGIERLRIGSLEPKIATPEFAAGLSKLKHFCPHFHLSLQSGSNATLKRMNRRYTAEEFMAGVQALRAVFPDAAMTTDVIVGFPGESEAEFRRALRLSRKSLSTRPTSSPIPSGREPRPRRCPSSFRARSKRSARRACRR